MWDVWSLSRTQGRGDQHQAICLHLVATACGGGEGGEGREGERGGVSAGGGGGFYFWERAWWLVEEKAVKGNVLVSEKKEGVLVEDEME